jgi:hypothetical protein
MLVTIPAGFLDLTFSTMDSPLRSVEMGSYRVTLYLLNCGAICDFDVAVDQERVLLPYFVVSERLHTFDESDDATVEVLGMNELRVTTSLYTPKDPRVQVFQIKPYFFF